MRVVIIGAGMAGLACAQALQAAGHAVSLLDKGRGPGGRMSTRRVEAGGDMLSFDHGAQYFTARDPAFVAQVQAWHELGLAAPWPAASPDAWVGTPAMNSPLAAMAAASDVRFSRHVMGLVREGGGWRARLQGGGCSGVHDAAVVALPAEQAAAFLGAHDLVMALRAQRARSQPCWTLLAGFPHPLALARDVVRDAGPIVWAARNSAKPMCAGAEALVVQATAEWTQAHLELGADVVMPMLLDAFAEVAGPLPEPTYAAAHRWRYARAATGNEGQAAMWNPALRLGACGDWLLGPRVELAWLSGTRLAQAMAPQLVV